MSVKLYNIFCLVFFYQFTNTICLVGQVSSLDSLDKLILHEEDPLVQEQLLWKAAKIAYDTESKLVANYTQPLLDLDRIQSDSNELIRVLNQEGLADRRSGNFPKGIRLFTIVYNYCKSHGDDETMAMAADQIGTMHTFLGNMQKAQPFVLETYSLYKALGDKKNIANATNGLAIFYGDIGNTEKAIEKYKEALVQYQAIGDTMGQANIHANLGMTYIEENQLTKAEYHLSMQGKLDTLLGTQWGLGFHFDFMGYLRRKQGRYDEALASYKKSLIIRQGLDSHYNVAESRGSLAQIYYDLKNYKQSIIEAKLILKDKDLHHSLTQEESAYYHLSNAYAAMENYKTSLHFHKKYKLYADSIYDKKLLEEITEKDAIHEKVIHENKISFLDGQNESKSEVLRYKNKILNVGGGFIVLILGLLFFLYRLYKSLGISKKMLETALVDKDILLREIHHRVKNNLQTISSLLTLQGRSISNEVAIQAINDGRNRVRSMAIIHQDLYNRENLTDIAVKDYFEKLCRELFDTYKVNNDQIQLIMDVEDMDIDIDTLIPLGLIINELITNTLKYAFPDGQAGALKIDFSRDSQTEDIYKLSIEDDGVGYDQNVVRPDSFGTTLIAALVSQLDGVIKTTTLNGTKSHLSFSTH